MSKDNSSLAFVVKIGSSAGLGHPLLMSHFGHNHCRHLVTWANAQRSNEKNCSFEGPLSSADIIRLQFGGAARKSNQLLKPGLKKIDFLGRFQKMLLTQQVPADLTSKGFSQLLGRYKSWHTACYLKKRIISLVFYEFSYLKKKKLFAR